MQNDTELLAKVFRLRRLPNSVVTLRDAAVLLSKCLGDLDVDDVTVFSLATAIDFSVNSPEKVATLQFHKVPCLVRQNAGLDEWRLQADDPGSVLIVDFHFLGMTPLNDVDPEKHMFDSISISGLSSHPFGSWQPRGADKSFMWIRDELPAFVPGVRAFTYGYDTNLINSNSFQLISDIARGFIEHLRIGGWSLTSARPIVFLAHSLGGLVLKDALVQIADARNELDRSLLDKVRGAIMFGVPNLGMEQSHLLAMVEGRPNEILVDDLSRKSNYIMRLDESFSGIAFTSRFTVFWAYETCQSHTTIRNLDGSSGWNKRGPLAILVNSRSATCRLDEKNPSMTFPINETHSEMVKFPKGCALCKIVCSKLRQMCDIGSPMAELKPINDFDGGLPARHSSRAVYTREKIKKNDFIDILNAPNLDIRLQTIESTFGATFEWIFEHSTFTDWLQHGTGIFWIYGKPGSGKSTLMKYIFQDARTWDLIHDWKRGAKDIRAGFFFHYRGTAMQKSFEGVLRSLLRQLLLEEKELKHLLLPEFEWKLDQTANAKEWTITELEKALRLILDQNIYALDICLFFDALDEFDGHSNLICRFLKEIVNIYPDSSCRVKVCFSSRPWDVFSEHFNDLPNLRLQDFTENDIRDYCVGTIVSAQATLTTPIHDLVPDLVERAAGVFLWVKLVVKELLIEASPPQSKSVEELRDILQELPLELDQYYELIIQRTARSNRWETYVLLELVILRWLYPTAIPTIQHAIKSSGNE
ncbi:unnamed protein product [Clonostachys rosea]|uniref:Nephrocystin 3-like N-terminal domain-containing protein n=1 Tax=Bionectria ochroleuca TaxID=29856 RepID=A0ABY6TUR8_BIOOC|nr:unnamed protein product [Clonostachys rosea]